ncbi:MAG: hypothetical protein ACKVQU_11715 [Burkholderiales bacterium]
MKSTLAKFLFAIAATGSHWAAAQTLPGPLPTDFGALLMPQLEGGSRYRLAAGSDMAYDNNIYRVPGRPSQVLISPGNAYSNSSWIGRYYAQGNIDLPVSRQRFLGQVTGNAYKFQSHGYLDYTSIDYRAGWLWEAGDSLKGVLRYDHQNGLADFIDVRPTTKNVRTYENWLGSAEFAVTPRWALTGGLSGYSAKNGDTGFAPGDLRQRMTEFGVKYNATGLNYIRAFYAKADGRYPKRVQTPTLDDQFEQRDIGIEALYQVSDATNFTGRYVRTKREYPDIPGNNQENPNWRIDFNWGFSPKTSLNLNTRKEYGIFEDVAISSTAYLTTIYGIAPWWEIVPTVRIEVAYERWKREFSGLTPVRNDELEFWRVSARWTPNRNWMARVGLLQSKRDSTDNALDFADRVIYGTAEYRF